MDVCLLWVFCVVRQRSLYSAAHSSRGVLQSVVCVCVCVCVSECDREASIMKRPWPTRVLSRHGGGGNKDFTICT
jgi:hypothetical protein